MGLKDLFHRRPKTDQQVRPEIRAQIQQASDAIAKQTLTKMFVDGESLILESARRYDEIKADTSDPRISGLADRYFGPQQSNTYAEISDSSVNVFLERYPPGKRQELLVDAFGGTAEFLTTQLERPDLTSGQTSVGRQRLSHYHQRIAETMGEDPNQSPSKPQHPH